MATLHWTNTSRQSLTRIIVVNGEAHASGLDPGASYSMDDANVSFAGWAPSGFTGFMLSLTPAPPGYSGVFWATESLTTFEPPK